MPDPIQVTAQDAKTFLGNYGHDVTKIDDAGAVKLYGDVYPKHTKVLEEATTKAKAGENWRQDYVTAAKAVTKDPTSFDDKKLMTRLERYANSGAVTDALFQLQDRISRGEMRSTLPKDAKPEDIARWRTENGVPEKPEGYVLNLGDGFEPSADDKAIIENIRKAAHAGNWHPTQFSQAVDSYYDIVESQTTAREALEAKAKNEAEDHFRKVWGGDYRRNVLAIETLLDMGPQGTKEDFFRARMPDGTPLASHKGVLTFLIDRARDLLDMTTIVPAEGAQMAKSIEDEMTQIQKMMGDRNSDYYKGEKVTKDGITDTKLAHRWRDLERSRQHQVARAARK